MIISDLQFYDIFWKRRFWSLSLRWTYWTEMVSKRTKSYKSMICGFFYYPKVQLPRLQKGSVDFWLSGNFWLVSFKISYLCLPLFYEPRTTPSCHPSGCAYRQLWYCQFRQECWPFWYLSWWKKVQLKEDKTNPDIISYGFGEYRIIQDYPIRGRATYLHVRKRKWLDKSSNEIFSYDWDLSDFDGTRLNSEFVSFLKEGDWIYSCGHLCACGTLWRKRADSS